MLRMPTITKGAMEYIEPKVTKESKVLEFGSGASTLWFSDKCKEVISFEHDREWARRVRSELSNKTIVRLFPSALTGEGEEYLVDSYAKFIVGLPDNYFDLLLVDGRDRVACFLLSLPKMKKGSLIILDDSNREAYQPIISHMENFQKQAFQQNEWETTVWHYD